MTAHARRAEVLPLTWIRRFATRGTVSLALACLATLAPSTAQASDAPPGHGPAPAPATAPVPHTHAHNDYLHDHPLFDALSHGFSSVESDIWLADNGALVDDPLLVGHTKAALQHGHTLQDLYLDPMLALVQQHGHIYAAPGQVTLLIDVKGDAAGTYTVLDRLLSSSTYRPMLTSWTKTGTNAWATTEGPVRAIISGNRDRATMLGAPLRFAGYDGRLSDFFVSNPTPGSVPVAVSPLPSPGFMPLISQSWDSVFSWKGTGVMPADQRALLATVVARLRDNGQEVRFYGTPDRSASQYISVWNEERAAKVDWLNSDELAELAAFVTNHWY